MTKGYDDYLLGVVTNILKDVGNHYPSLRKEWERDSDRVSLLCRTRGIKCFTLDFPAAAKLLESSLASGRLNLIGTSCFGGTGLRPFIPRLFQGLWLHVFDNEGLLLDDPDITAIFFLRELLLFAKKMNLDCDVDRVHDAVEEFYRIEAELPIPSRFWEQKQEEPIEVSLGLLYGNTANLALLDLAQKVADLVVSGFPEFDPYGQGFKHGPGAVSDLRGGSYKYDFPTWSEHLEPIFPYSEFAFANYEAWIDAVSSRAPVDTNPQASRLICVPKTQKGPRLIAAEPTAHQWCQQNVREYLTRYTERSCLREAISFDDQSRNAALALEASQSGEYSTIDLSSASDRVSCSLVEAIWRRNPSVLKSFRACRTTLIENNITPSCPQRAVLRKFSTMGSAITFPQQTILYAILAVTSVLFVENRRCTLANVRFAARRVQVFGDDIIVPTTSGAMCLELLITCGFAINPAKTFLNGRFRESCGTDAYDGVDVTPAYVREYPDERRPLSIVSCIETSNNFFKKGLWSTSRYIDKAIGRFAKSLPTVAVDSGVFGRVSFCGESYNHLKKRWNGTLHRDEYRMTSLKSKVSSHAIAGYGPLLQYFTEDPDPQLDWVSGRKSRPKSLVTLRWGAGY